MALFEFFFQDSLHFYLRLITYLMMMMVMMMMMTMTIIFAFDEVENAF